MRPALALPALLLCAACNTPTPEFAGLPAQRIAVAQSTFLVRVAETRAEAIRTSIEPVRTLAAVAPRAQAALEQASGCRVVPGTLTGDAAMMRADLDCP